MSRGDIGIVQHLVATDEIKRQTWIEWFPTDNPRHSRQRWVSRTVSPTLARRQNERGTPLVVRLENWLLPTRSAPYAAPRTLIWLRHPPPPPSPVSRNNDGLVNEEKRSPGVVGPRVSWVGKSNKRKEKKNSMPRPPISTYMASCPPLFPPQL